MEEKIEKATSKKTAPKFTKGQLVQSARYAANRDLLNALLEEHKAYSYEETDSIIQVFFQKESV